MNLIIKFSKRTDGGPKFVGPFKNEQQVTEHINALMGQGISGKYKILELADWKASVEYCLGNDTFPIGVTDE